MSLNIQTATGLLEIGGNVTKEKVISALGYEPADKAHTEDKTVHVTSAEKETWNNKSDFSGAYADLIDAPNITENDSGNMVIADESGNIIMQVDADGLSTTNVNTKTIKLDGEDLGTRLDELESSKISGIVEDESGKVEFADEVGNVIARINADGLETTTVTAESAVIGGVDIGTKLDEYKEAIDDVSGDLTTHTSNSTVHITADERTLWNNKSDFSGDYNDLANAPDIKEDASGEVVYADESGNVIAKIGENGFETTQVIADTVIAHGVNVGTTLSSHIGNADIHITAEERNAWNEKASTVYVDGKVAGIVNSAPETLNTLNELAAALGDDPNFATTVATQIGLKADKSTLDSHTSDKVVHITSDERAAWDNKSDFSGDYNDLENAPNITEDGSDSIVYADEAGNIIAKIDSNGFETTTVTAKSVVANGVDVGIALEGKASSEHTHEQYLTNEDIVNKVDKTYIDEELAKKANYTHTHEQYLETSDLDGLATTAYVGEQLATKANKSELHNHTNKPVLDGITSDKVSSWDNKSEFSGNYSDLVDAPNITEDDSDNLVIADRDGNIIFRSDGAGFETTTLTAQNVVVNGTDVETVLNAKANTNYVDEKVEEVKVDSSNKDAVILSEAQRYVDEKVEEVKANSSDKDAVILIEAQKGISDHANNTEVHITADERERWNSQSEWSIVEDTSTSITVTVANKTEYYFPNATSVTINAPTDITRYECWISIGGTTPTINLPATMECVGVDNRNIYSNIGHTEISIKNGKYVVGCVGT